MTGSRIVLPLFMALVAFAIPCGPVLAVEQPAPGRLILIKSDGLPADLLSAVALPERADLMARLPYAPDLQAALREYQRRTGRQFVIPNIRKHFYQEGVVLDGVYSHTITLSAVAWSIIDTGQPSIIKGHGTFSRDTSYLRSHLDGLRDTIDALRRRPGYGQYKTAATWKLDQVGVSLMLDAFDPLRAWSGPQIYRRIANRELLLEGGLRWLTADGEGFGGILRGHLSRIVTGIDYSEFNQEMNSIITHRKILQKTPLGSERFDYISPLFTLMDHQQHVDPHPVNLLHWLSKLDEAIGRIFAAVAISERRDETIVALSSDHGSEIKPGQTGYSFLLTKAFREPLLGSHNVKTLLVENAFSAVTTPIPGLDWPRLYESRHSPYGKKQNPQYGEEGFATAFLDPFGNGRAAVHIRNDDLNRLHLLLLALKERPQGQRWERLRLLFEETLQETSRWMEPDLSLWEDYHAGALDLARNLTRRADGDSRDTAGRLLEEGKRDARQIKALKQLFKISFTKDCRNYCFEEIFSRDFQISSFLPKGYLGRPNSLYQLANYTMGLDDNLNWIDTTADHRGREVPMDYFQILSEYRASNAPVNGLANPFDFIVATAPLEPTRAKLLSLDLIEAEDRLVNVAWVKSTHADSPRKGGEALLVEADGRRIKYIPMRNLKQRKSGDIDFVLAADLDPLALLSDEEFTPRREKSSRLEWLRTFHDWREWLAATHRTEYSTGVVILLDIISDAAPRFLGNPRFQEQLVNFSSPLLKQRYLRGLERKYSNQFPDFLVWADELWNFNSKARTSGGNHSGLRPITAKTVLVLWGGSKIGLEAGRMVEQIGSTIDVVPTLLKGLGMLGPDNRVIPAKGANPMRSFLPFPGQALDIFGRQPSLANGMERQAEVAR